MLQDCAVGQLPLRSLAPNSGPFFAEGSSPGELCSLTSAVLGAAPIVSISAYQCVIEGYPPVAIASVCQFRDGSPFSMSAVDGALLAGLIISVWVSAAVFRWFYRAVYNGGSDD